MNKSEMILLLHGCIKTITKKHHKGFDYCTVFFDEIIDTLCRKITDNFKKKMQKTHFIYIFLFVFFVLYLVVECYTWSSVTYATY